MPAGHGPETAPCVVTGWTTRGLGGEAGNMPASSGWAAASATRLPGLHASSNAGPAAAPPDGGNPEAAEHIGADAAAKHECAACCEHQRRCQCHRHGPSCMAFGQKTVLHSIEYVARRAAVLHASQEASIKQQHSRHSSACWCSKEAPVARRMRRAVAGGPSSRMTVKKDAWGLRHIRDVGFEAD